LLQLSITLNIFAKYSKLSHTFRTTPVLLHIYTDNKANILNKNLPFVNI